MIFLISQDGKIAVRTDTIKTLYVGFFTDKKCYLGVSTQGDEDDIVMGYFSDENLAIEALEEVASNLTQGFSTRIKEESEVSE